MKYELKKPLSQSLLGLAFVAAGLISSYLIAGTLVVGHYKSSDWVEVPATLHSVNLNVIGGDSNTYSVSSNYSYRFEGIEYSGDRVNFSLGSDSGHKYWSELEKSLRAYQSTNEATAIVNPKNPYEAVLDRSLRMSSILFGLLFLIVFSGAGCIVIWTGLRNSKE